MKILKKASEELDKYVDLFCSLYSSSKRFRNKVKRIAIERAKSLNREFVTRADILKAISELRQI